MSFENLQGQTERGIHDQELREEQIQRRALWLAGLFEAGGGMSITTHTFKDTPKRRAYTSTYPVISFTDNDEQRVRTLQELFGGIVSKTHWQPNSWKWAIQWRKAQVLANQLHPYTPSRHEFMSVMQQWDGMTLEERLQTAAELKEEPRFIKRTVPSVSAYEGLIKHPEFVAGTIDSRGSIYVGKKTRRVLPVKEYPVISTTTFNTSLLQALWQAYGGKMDLYRSERTGENMYWTIARDPARKLYAWIQPYLVLRAQLAADIFGSTTGN